MLWCFIYLCNDRQSCFPSFFFFYDINVLVLLPHSGCLVFFYLHWNLSCFSFLMSKGCLILYSFSSILLSISFFNISVCVCMRVFNQPYMYIYIFISNQPDILQRLLCYIYDDFYLCSEMASRSWIRLKIPIDKVNSWRNLQGE